MDADHRVGAGSDGDLDAQDLSVSGGQCDGDQVGVGDVDGEVDHELQRVAGIGGQQAAGDRRRGPQPVLAGAGDVVEPGVGDRDTGGGGERGDEVLVLAAELAVAALAEVEVAEHLAPDPDRDAEEAVHRGMVLGEARGSGVVGDARDPDRDRVLHQRAEQALAVWQVPDGRHGVRE